MQIVPYEPWHLLSIAVQPAQKMADVVFHDEQNARELGAAGPVFTALAGGVPIAIAGVAGRGLGRGMVWSVLAPAALLDFAPIHRAALRFLDLQDYRRLEAVVDCEFAAAVRWIEHLGFEREGRMRAYTPQGRDCFLYGRVR